MEEWARSKAQISDAWRDSGLLVSYEWDFPFPIPDGEVAGVPWRDVYARGRWGGGGAGDVQQLLEYFIVNVWPYAKVAGTAAAATIGAKAGSDAWDVVTQGLKHGLRRILAISKKVEVDVVEDSAVANDILYEIGHDALDTIDAAVDSIKEHAKHVHDGKVPRPGTNAKLRWNGGSHQLELIRWNEKTQDWEQESPPGESA